MTTSHHARTPLARAALAAGGLLALVVLAGAMELIAGTIGGARGLFAAVLFAGVVFSGCGLAHSLRSRRAPGLTRPAPVRLPDPVTNPPEPARTAA